MKIAHEVAMLDGLVAATVETRLRQRIGKDRMDLWFGGDAKWTQIGHNVIGVEVASSFIADCVSKMFRDDLQAAVVEAAGSHFGFQISVASPFGVTASQPEQPPQTSQDDSVLVSKACKRPNTPNLESSRPVVRLQDRNKADAPALLRNVRNGTLRQEPIDVDDMKSASVEIQVDRLMELRRENERRWDEFVAGDHN